MKVWNTLNRRSVTTTLCLNLTSQTLFDWLKSPTWLPLTHYLYLSVSLMQLTGSNLIMQTFEKEADYEAVGYWCVFWSVYVCVISVQVISSGSSVLVCSISACAVQLDPRSSAKAAAVLQEFCRGDAQCGARPQHRYPWVSTPVPRPPMELHYSQWHARHLWSCPR